MALSMFENRFVQIKQADEPIYRTPKSLQDEVQVMRVAENGIFQVNKDLYSACYKIEDINALTQGDMELVDILDKYCMMLNSLNVAIKIVIFNKNQDMQYIKDKVLYKLNGDTNDQIRDGFNQLIEDGIRNKRKGILQEKYLILSIKRDTYESAQAIIETNVASLAKHFGAMRSSLTPCNAKERFKILHDFFRMGEEERELPEFKEYVLKSSDWKNDILCGHLKFDKDGKGFSTDRKSGRCIYVTDYPTHLSVNFINSMTSEAVNTITAIDIVPIPQDVSVKLAEKKYMAVEKDISDQQKKRNKNNNFSSDISYKKRMEKKDIEGVLDDLRESDQKMFLGSVNIVVVSDTKDELEDAVVALESTAGGFSCNIATAELQQREALNTVLPYGCRQISNQRTMLTRDVAALMPFAVQELQIVNDKQGFPVFYGRNQVDHKNLYGNRKSLGNGNGCIFGVSGFGKSFFAKEEMSSVLLNSSDDVIVIDPTLEYEDFCHVFDGQFIDFSLGSKNKINPLDIDLDNITPAKINEKIEFALALISNCMKEELSARHMSIISRCLKLLYEKLAEVPREKRVQAKIGDFYRVLEKFNESEAEYLHLSMEVFVSGALDMFNHQTNINTNNRFTVYGIKDMPESLLPACMLSIIENITARIDRNFKKGKSTWFYVDEFHNLLNREFSIQYMAKLWAEVRKKGGLCTALTQNIVTMINNSAVSTILSNSEFIALFNQSAMDADKVCEVVNGMTPTYLDYVFNSRPGTGLLKHGKVIVPFENEVPKDSVIYKLFNTNFHEIEAEKKLRSLS